MNQDKTVVLVTGGFDPIHSGHISYINSASTLGQVVIGLNSDAWLQRKKGAPFMPFHERYEVLSNLRSVAQVIDFDDSDGTAINAVSKARWLFPEHKIIFANGGDRNASNIPEMEAFRSDLSVEFVFGVGGEDKRNSSSWILSEWKNPTENRVWGKFMTYYDSTQTRSEHTEALSSKVKRLVIDPGASISMQYHKERAELWFIEYGSGVVSSLDNVYKEPFVVRHLAPQDYHVVPANTWHKLTNTGEGPLAVIEIQYGSQCSEADIIRLA